MRFYASCLLSLVQTKVQYIIFDLVRKKNVQKLFNHWMKQSGFLLWYCNQNVNGSVLHKRMEFQNRFESQCDCCHTPTEPQSGSLERKLRPPARKVLDQLLAPHQSSLAYITQNQNVKEV